MPYKCKKAQAKYFQDYYYLHREYKDHCGRKSHLKLNFGITSEDYQALLEKQNFSCALCKKHSLEFKQRLAVDHCHETGKIRGLLCFKCNTALGKFNDDPEMLKEAIKYLEKNTGV